MKNAKCLGGLFSATDVFTECVQQCMQEKKTFLVFLNYKRQLPGQILINDEVNEWFSNNGLYSNEPRILYRPIIDKNGVNGYTAHYSENICANILVPQTIINQPYEVFIKTVITDLERKNKQEVAEMEDTTVHKTVTGKEFILTDLEGNPLNYNDYKGSFTRQHLAMLEVGQILKSSSLGIMLKRIK